MTPSPPRWRTFPGRMPPQPKNRQTWRTPPPPRWPTYPSREPPEPYDRPIQRAQLSAAVRQPAERVQSILEQVIAEFEKPEHGVTVREVAGGYKMATKAEHHDAVRSFVKSLKPPLKLSLPALETLAVIAYKQPVTGPEVLEIRGVQGGGVMKTLLDRKLIAVAGRKNVIGKPMLYKTTKEFLLRFGLKDVN